jgi:hypothetical protein
MVEAGIMLLDEGRGAYGDEMLVREVYVAMCRANTGRICCPEPLSVRTQPVVWSLASNVCIVSRSPVI